MITSIGKNIIGKYLLGQAPAYASYIAIGCGPTPLDTNDTSADFSLKKNLEFEMFRVPISSRGFVNENGVDKIVFTAELPTEERYEISEIGLYSAGSNPSAGVYDSKTIFAFTTTEGWQYATSAATTEILSKPEALDGGAGNIILDNNGVVFKTNADNTIFFNPSRANRYERCRFLNNVILIRGDQANLTLSSESDETLDHFVIESESNHIRLTGANIDLSRNSPNDELKLAFSLVNRDGNSASIPETVRILVEFSSPDGAQYARFEAELNQGSSGNLADSEGEYNTLADFEENRYFVISKKLQDLYKTENFSWEIATVIKIYACVITDESGEFNVPSNNYYIALDALRLENTQTVNPLYGLTGYSIVKNENQETVIKSPNTSNYVEFRFSVGVS
jgi:hypothetical protein